MTLVPLVITTVCYLWVAAGFYAESNYGLSLAFVGYSLANFGFIGIALWGQP